MAERRMFAKTIIDSDAFLDMPLSAQALYFHLSMRADDEGFVGNPKRIRNMINASEDDMKLLLLKRFILAFASGVVVIKHWKIHNYIQSDRCKPTTYLEERATLTLDGKKAYKEKDVDTDCIQNGYNVDTQVSLDKDRVSIEEINKENHTHIVSNDTQCVCQKKSVPDGTAPKRFVKPTVEEIAQYCAERGNNVDAQKFYDYYESNGWKVGRNSMKDWKAAVRTWERNGYDGGGTAKSESPNGESWMETLKKL